MEICIGEFMVLMNNSRQRYGTLWEIDKAMRDTYEQIVALSDSSETEESIAEKIQDIFDFTAYLEEKGELIIPFEKFLDIYIKSGRNNAVSLMDPLKVLELTEEQSIRKCFALKENGNVTLHFLDLNNKSLYNETLSLQLLKRYSEEVEKPAENIELSSQRIISARDFFLAFNSLQADFRKQIINDPFRLILNKNNIFRVLIAGEQINGTVKITFEILENQEIKQLHFFGRDIAVALLIEKINAMTGN